MAEAPRVPGIADDGRSGDRRKRASRQDGPGRPTRTVALVGLMGVGKTSVGRRLALRLGLPFFDADAEIEAAAGRSVSDIFADLGEAEFRAGEHRVIRRLLEGPPHVLATGGGAFMHPATRELLKAHAVTVWLKAGTEVLVKRATRRDTRPLLRRGDPRQILEDLAARRSPTYALADLVVETGDGTHAEAVDAVLDALAGHGAISPP